MQPWAYVLHMQGPHPEGILPLNISTAPVLPVMFWRLGDLEEEIGILRLSYSRNTCPLPGKRLLGNTTSVSSVLTAPSCDSTRGRTPLSRILTSRVPISHRWRSYKKTLSLPPLTVYTFADQCPHAAIPGIDRPEAGKEERYPGASHRC